MDAQGDLADKPIGLLLFDLSRGEATGLLHLEDEDRKTWIYLERGAPAGVFDPNAEVYLGMILQERGLIDAATFNDSLMRMAESGKLQGQVLLEMGVVDEAQLSEALRVQMVRKVSQLFAMRRGQYRFDPQGRMPERRSPHPVSARAIIYQGIRNHYETADLDTHLAPLADKLIGVGPDTVAACDEFRFEADERADLDLLTQHRTVTDFANRARAGATAARMITLTLYWCDLLVIGEAGQAPVIPAAAPTSAPPKQPSPRQVPAKPASPAPAKPGSKQERVRVPDEIRRMVNSVYKKAVAKDLLGMLDCSAGTTPEEMQQKHKKLISVFHPDRYAKYGDQELSLRVQRIAATLNGIQQIIDDPQKRIDYLNYAIGAGPRPMTLNPDAARAAYQKAKVYLQKKNLAQAIESLKLASRLDPKNPTYRARLIWFEYSQVAEAEPALSAKVKHELLRLHQATPNNFWANRLLALVCHALGEAEEHEHYLRRAKRIRPDDIDNSRDLRLLEMRRKKAAK